MKNLQTFFFSLLMVKEICLKKNLYQTSLLLLFFWNMFEEKLTSDIFSLAFFKICLKKLTSDFSSLAPSSEHEIFSPGLAKSSSPRSQNTWAFEQYVMNIRQFTVKIRQINVNIKQINVNIKQINMNIRQINVNIKQIFMNIGEINHHHHYQR